MAGGAGSHLWKEVQMSHHCPPNCLSALTLLNSRGLPTEFKCKTHCMCKVCQLHWTHGPAQRIRQMILHPSKPHLLLISIFLPAIQILAIWGCLPCRLAILCCTWGSVYCHLRTWHKSMQHHPHTRCTCSVGHHANGIEMLNITPFVKVQVKIKNRFLFCGSQLDASCWIDSIKGFLTILSITVC